MQPILHAIKGALLHPVLRSLLLVYAQAAGLETSPANWLVGWYTLSPGFRESSARLRCARRQYKNPGQADLGRALLAASTER